MDIYRVLTILKGFPNQFRKRLVAQVTQVRRNVGVHWHVLTVEVLVTEGDNRWVVGRAHKEMETNQVPNVSLYRNGGGGRCSWKGWETLHSRCPHHLVNRGRKEALSI